MVLSGVGVIFFDKYESLSDIRGTLAQLEIIKINKIGEANRLRSILKQQKKCLANFNLIMLG